MPGWVSPWELLILVLVVVLFFGPKRLPEMGRGLGKGMREFRDSLTGRDEKRAAEVLKASAPAPQGSVPAAPAPAPQDRDTV